MPKLNTMDYTTLKQKHSQELKERLKDENFLLNALVYELNIHNYSITGEVDKAIEALGLKKEEIDSKVLDKAIIYALAMIDAKLTEALKSE